MIIHHDPFTKLQKKPQMNRLYYLAVLAKTMLAHSISDSISFWAFLGYSNSLVSYWVFFLYFSALAFPTCISKKHIQHYSKLRKNMRVTQSQNVPLSCLSRPLADRSAGWSSLHGHFGAELCVRFFCRMEYRWPCKKGAQGTDAAFFKKTVCHRWFAAASD